MVAVGVLQRNIINKRQTQTHINNIKYVKMVEASIFYEWF